MTDLPIVIGDPGTNYGPLVMTGGADDTVTLSLPDTLPDSAPGVRRINRVVEIACATNAITVAGAAGDIAAGRGTPVAANEKYPVLFQRNGQQVFIQGTAAANVSVRVRS